MFDSADIITALVTALGVGLVAGATAVSVLTGSRCDRRRDADRRRLKRAHALVNDLIELDDDISRAIDQRPTMLEAWRARQLAGLLELADALGHLDDNDDHSKRGELRRPTPSLRLVDRI